MAAGIDGPIHQLVGCHPRIGALAKDLGNPIVSELVEQPVTAQ